MRFPDHFYMDIAELVAKQSYCKRNKVGAVIVKDLNILSFGYNGTPKGFDNCCEIDGTTKSEVLHAESNAIIKCAKSTVNCDGAALYVTTSPCEECAKLIIQAGITRVVYKHLYRSPDGLALLRLANIETHTI